MDLRAIIDNLQDIHFYDVILPFILVYAVVFAILQKSGIFNGEGENSHVRSINSVVAFVFGLFVVASLQTVLYIQNLIVNVVLFIVFILVVLIVLGFIFGEDYKKIFQKSDGSLNWMIAGPIAGISFIVILIVFLQITGMWDWLVDWYNSFSIGGETFTTLLVLAGLVGFMVWISRDTKTEPSK